ncbi:VanZ family protein [Mycobacterium sp. NPDC050551]|uniref:VanZ family protein n=1 Tax=Mycobacterium sp. NPDC050551 TaxID=3155407 RepID=UPI003440B90E
MPDTRTRAASRARRRRVLTLWTAAYVGVIALIVFWPSTEELVNPSLRWIRHVTHAPLSVVEFSTNVLLFIPFGMLAAAYLTRRRWWLAMLAGAAASAGIELTQAVLLPGRDPSLSDIAANTAGATLGVLVVSVIRLAWRRDEPVGEPAVPAAAIRPRS